MEHDAAVAVLNELSQARDRTRVKLEGLWFPLVLFGVLMAGSAVVAMAISGPAVAVYWALAGPLGGTAIIAGCFVGYWAGSTLASATFAAVAPFLVISVAYQIPAHLERRARFGAIAAALGACALALGVSDVAAVTVSALLSAVYGLTFVLYGLKYRAEDRGAR